MPNQADIFFGREQDLQSLMELYLSQDIFAVHGKSGVGKSSLLHAGLLPRIKAETDDLTVLLRFGNWQSENNLSIVKILEHNLGPLISSENPTLRLVEKEKNTLWYWLKQLQNRQADQVITLIIDQAEELFSYPYEAMEEFQEELSTVLGKRIPQSVRWLLLESDQVLSEEEQHFLTAPIPLKAILAIRSDRLSLLGGMADHFPAILQCLYELQPLRMPDAKDAIIGPAISRGEAFYSPSFDYSPEAVAQFLDFLTDKKGGVETVQLQLLLQAIEQEYVVEQGKIRIEAEDIANLINKDILSESYEKVIHNLPVPHQDKARRFIEEGLIADGKRLALPESIIQRAYEIGPEVLKSLLATRLIRAEVSPLGGFTYELSHDALVAPITRSFERRRKAEEEYRRKAEEEARARQLARARRRTFFATSMAVLGIALASIAIVFYLQAQKAQARAEASAYMAIKQQKNTEDILSIFQEQQKQNAVERYNRYLTSGKAWMAQSQYESAIGEFERALETVQDYATAVGDSTAVNMIGEGGREAQRLFEETISIHGHQIKTQTTKARFEKLIAEGDLYMDLGPKYYVDARHKYQEARELGYNRSLADGKINTLAGKLEPAFDTFVKNGDTFFEADGYQLALENYRQALRIKPGDSYVKARIEYCKKLLSSD